ncbi:RES family NAD+ phosphorylase [Nesterenkonia haasae]|uniref:RES family NAD+ phosphorylase n=1 Tax=Nesterenkonia haasae TaxID=2587813 RepID=UPI0013920581|nr:RES family NAD+ phosphorylase [Nesterenkonia haasae]NDK31193.1 RES domain-containing protein [Nesterenkonia haasae]
METDDLAFPSEYPACPESWAPYLDSMTLNEIESRIERFDQIAWTLGSPERLRDELYAVLTPPHRSSFPVVSAEFRNIPEATNVYRVRQISSPEQIKESADVWHAPPNLVGAGRLNREQESLLYTANSPKVAIAEARVQVGDMFALSEYEAAHDIPVVLVGQQASIAGLNALQATKKRLLDAFFLRIFTTPSLPNGNRPYVATEVLAKEFYDYPADVCTGWMYDSISSPGGVNFAFRPDESQRVLQFKCVHLARLLHTGPEAYGWYMFDVKRQRAGRDELVSVATNPQGAD